MSHNVCLKIFLKAHRTFLLQALLWHPDKNPDPSAPARFQQLQDAVTVLEQELVRLQSSSNSSAFPPRPPKDKFDPRAFDGDVGGVLSAHNEPLAVVWHCQKCRSPSADLYLAAFLTFQYNFLQSICLAIFYAPADEKARFAAG